MGQKSSIDVLPEELRQELLSLLSDPKITQKDIVDLINLKAGSSVLSRSAVNRYAIKMKKFTEKSRQAKEVARMYIQQTGTDTENTLGRLINEQVRMLSFDLLNALEEVRLQDNVADPKALEQLSWHIFRISKAVKEIEQSSTINAEREKKIKEQTLSEAAEKVSGLEGLSQEAVLQIKEKILGVR